MDAQVLVTAMADLSRAATGDFAVEEMLRALCTAAADALKVDGTGVMISERDLNRFVHATTADVSPVELLQEALQAGPCADSLRLQQSVAVPDLEQETRWPEFQALSEQLGLGSVLAVPLLSRGRGWGVLDLYRRQPGPWTEDELQAAAVLADVAVSYIVMAHDRDDAREAHRALAHQAMHDDLTGLANRALLFDRLEHVLSAAARDGAGTAVLFLDLDLFKAINDTFGHTAGDQVLTEVARRLSGALRAGDTLARFAGDEFVLVCPGLPRASPDALAGRVAAMSSRVQRVLSQPIALGQVEVVVSASIGVAITTDRLSAQELIGEADTAMYLAKQAGRGRVSVRDHTTSSAVGYAGQLERDLAGALDRGELRVYYQPIVAAGPGRRPVAVEALLRWKQPHNGILPAAAFIDIAVKTGLITTIGRWVIEQTCAQMNRWHSQLGDRAPATAFVNLSARELADAALPAALAAALAANGLRPAQLGLEVVEDHLADPEITRRLERYHQQGHPLSVDDFGTGYSSLSRLLDLPVDIAKIDKSFVQQVPTHTRRTRLLDGILQLAATLDIDVVAEGVETADQADYLTAAGCRLLQGYHLAGPQPAADLTAQWARSADG